MVQTMFLTIINKLRLDRDQPVDRRATRPQQAASNLFPHSKLAGTNLFLHPHKAGTNIFPQLNVFT